MNPTLTQKKTEKTRLKKKLLHLTGKAIENYSLITAGDHIAVAVSGGKDSLAMLELLLLLKQRAPIEFQLTAIHLDQGQPGYDATLLPEHFERWQADYHIERQDTYSIVKEKSTSGDTLCALCSRLRRGILYRVARQLGCNKLALGHHRDDLIHTLIMNLFYSGKIGTMAPHYRIANEDLAVIRPLALIEESTIARYVDLNGWRLLPCTLCGSQEGLKRAETAELMAKIEKNHPGVKNSIFAAMGNIHDDELLDRNRWSHADFALPNQRKDSNGVDTT